MTTAVSVIIPAYNVAPYIGETLDSLFSQSYQNFEAVVVNDGSTDDLDHALAPYGDRIRYVTQENSGLSAARNTGIRHARGRYIALLDGDDIWLPRFLEVLVTRLEYDTELDLVYPNAVYFGTSTLAGRLFQDVYPSSEPVTFDRLIAGACHVFGSTVFRRTAVDRAGPFDETLRGGVEDFDMWLRMLQTGARLSFTPEVLVRYRRLAQAMSKQPTTMLRNQLRVLDNVVARGSLTADQENVIAERRRRVAAELNVVLARNLINTGDAAGALEHLRAANVYLQSPKLRLVAGALQVMPRIALRALQAIEAVSARS